MLACSPSMALPGEITALGAARPSSYLVLLLVVLSWHGLGSVAAHAGPGCLRAALHSSPSCFAHSMTTASGRSRARQPGCHPAPRGAHRSRSPEQGGRRWSGMCVHTTEQDAALGPSQTSTHPAIAALPVLHHLLLHTLLHALGLRNPLAAALTLLRCCGLLST